MALLPEVSKHYGKLKLYINGQWVESRSTRSFEDTNPARNEVIAEVLVALADEVD
jgi:acyl-CoA reductase-like NAD-dependent aldehyde dehydrogenase